MNDSEYFPTGLKQNFIESNNLANLRTFDSVKKKLTFDEDFITMPYEAG